MRAWGDYWEGSGWAAATVPPGLTNVTAIAAGTFHSLALKSDGTVIAWGINSYGQTNCPPGLTNVVSVAAGYSHSLALKADGTITTWGTGANANVPPSVHPAICVSVWRNHSLALIPSGASAIVDGVFARTKEPMRARGSAQITLVNPFANGTVLYTLDGSDPSSSGLLYSSPFTLRKTSTIRTIAYNADFSESVQSVVATVTILPTLAAITEGGSVAIDPPAGDYFSNAVAVATATPAPGWTFLQWLGDATGTNPVVSLSMTRSKALRAVFGTALNTSVVGGGSVVVEPVSALHPYGSQVQLTAVPAVGNYFAFWANAAAGQTNHALRFPVTNANPTVTAVFASLGSAQTNALTVIPSGGGQVVLAPPGNRFPRNSTVTVQAVPDAGQEFYGWSGAAGGSQNPLTVTMNSNQVIRAIFTRHVWLRGEGNPELLRDEGFRLTVAGEFGGFYGVLGSAEGGWLPLGTVATPWGVGQFTDPAGTTNRHRFYRTIFEAR